MSKTYNPGKYAQTVQGAPWVYTNPTSSSDNQWFDIAAVTSAALNVVQINCPLLTGSSHISLTTHVQGVETAGTFGGFVVTSTAPGSYFNVGPCSSIDALVTSYEVHWMIAQKG